jgi:hypothetical protein
MKRIVLAVLVAPFVCLVIPHSLEAQSDEFVSLFEGSFDGWTIENTDADNFTIVDGILHVEGGGGWLRSDRQYSDFVLRSEFRWLTSDADSGIYVRAIADSEFVRGWPNNSYQIQVRDPAGESRFPPVGGLFRHGTPAGESELDRNALSETYLGTGEWHVIEIEVVADLLRVRLNGTEIAHAQNIVNPSGYIGIQSELGTIEYRSIEIQER